MLYCQRFLHRSPPEMPLRGSAPGHANCFLWVSSDLQQFEGKCYHCGGDVEWKKDKAPSYAAAITELKKEGVCPTKLVHRQVKYLNNIVEADHGKLKRLIKPTLGFKSMKTAFATSRDSR